MAQKKGTRKARPKVVATDPISRLQSSMRGLQKDAEKLLGQTRKRANELIGKDQKRAVNRLIGEGRKMTRDIETRMRSAGKQLETQVERFLGTFEEEAGRRLTSIMKRLDYATSEQVQALSRRVAELEKRLRTR